MMGVIDRVARGVREMLREADARADLRRRMEQIDRWSEDLIEAGYYDEAEDLMDDRGELFRDYIGSLRRTFGEPPGERGRGNRE